MDQLTDGSAYSRMVTPSDRVILGKLKNWFGSRRRKKSNATFKARSHIFLIKGAHAIHCTTGISLPRCVQFLSLFFGEKLSCYCRACQFFFQIHTKIHRFVPYMSVIHIFCQCCTQKQRKYLFFRFTFSKRGLVTNITLPHYSCSGSCFYAIFGQIVLGQFNAVVLHLMLLY